MTFQASNKRIAKNTIILYMRQILIMSISLYTARIILRTLGADDYGVYNVVGGFVAMFNVISGAFSVAISRFMAYVIGEGDNGKLEDLFTTALMIQCCLGLLICCLLATVGIWYVINVMVLPEGRTAAALWVLFFSSVAFFINLISVPYNALIMAHEHMKAYAYIAVFEAVMKLFVAFAIVVLPFDKLITYSFLSVLAAMIVRFSYSVYCNRNFTGCKFRLRVHKDMLKGMMSFVGWAFVGNGAVVLRDQGATMILNLFGGPAVNAARAIAQNVNGSVSSFANNFIQATQPSITKLHASGQLAQMKTLIFRSCRISYFLMLIFSVPLIKNVGYVLHIWLGEVPAYTEIFIVLTLVESLMSALHTPLLYGVLAAGQIKAFEIAMSSMSVLSLPVIYGMLSFGAAPPSVYVVMVVLRFLIMLSLVWQSKTYGLGWKDFAAEVAVRILPATFLCSAVARVVNLPSINMPFAEFLLESALIVAVNGCVIFFTGFSSEERRMVAAVIKTKMAAKVSRAREK